jgi:Ca2+-binding RTX toxin-like protein
MRRICLSLAAVLLAAVPLGLRPSTSLAASCFGQPATHVMHAGDPNYEGTPGNDVVIGSTGPDSIRLLVLGGVDLVCGGGGDDRIFVAGPGSKADGGAGRDTIQVNDGGLALGSSGGDFLSAFHDGSRAEGGSGDDEVRVAIGASGDGGSGDDWLDGQGSGPITGGSGNDTVVSRFGTAPIDCGSGTDRVFARDSTDIRRCERTFDPFAA